MQKQINHIQLKMKHLIILLLLWGSLKAQTFTQATLPDTLIIVAYKDEMTDRTTHIATKKIVCNGGDMAFTIAPMINSNLSFRFLSVHMVGLGSCSQRNIMIILYEDGTKDELTSTHPFSCDNSTIFMLKTAELNRIKAKKISKIRLMNGHTYQSYTHELTEGNDYFIRLYKMLEAKQIFDFKE